MPGHPFYAGLNAILDEAGFDRFAEEQCAQFYADTSALESEKTAENRRTDLETLPYAAETER